MVASTYSGTLSASGYTSPENDGDDGTGPGFYVTESGSVNILLSIGSNSSVGGSGTLTSNLSGSEPGDGETINASGSGTVNSGGTLSNYNFTGTLSDGDFVYFTGAFNSSETAITGTMRISIPGGEGATFTFNATLTGTPPNQSPIVVPISATAYVGQPTTIQVIGPTLDHDPDGDTLTILNYPRANYGTVQISGNSLIYTPSAGAFGANGGSDTIYYTVNDGYGNSVDASVSVTVLQPQPYVNFTAQLSQPFSASYGTLKLDSSSTFTGTVAGLTGQDTIDLTDISFATAGQPTFAGTNSGGTLTVTDGTHTANISLIGNYLSSYWVLTNDGHGGTSIPIPQTIPPSYYSRDLAPTHTWITGINDAGQIVGINRDTHQGFVRTGASTTILNDPSGTNGTIPTAINDSGEIVGYYFDSQFTQHGFIYSGGTFSPLDYSSASSGNSNGTVPTSVNSTGAIGGYYTTAGQIFHGFIYKSGTFTTIDDPLGTTAGTQIFGINDVGEAVGIYLNGGDNSFLYDGSNFTTLSMPGARVTYAVGINNAGDVTGWYYDANGVQHDFLYRNGSYITLPPPSYGASVIYPMGINNNDQVVGYYSLNGLDNEGFVSTPTNLTIVAGQTLELSTPYFGDVTFLGSTGTLKIDNSSSFTGLVYGLNGHDTIDLVDMTFPPNVNGGYSGTSARGTLTETDGTHTANITLVGDYRTSFWVLSNDGNNGTAIQDPPQSDAPGSTAVIGAGQSLELPSGYSGSVTFAADTGTLVLDASSSFSGTVAGMTGSDAIDFAGLDPTKVQPPSFAGDCSGGTLTVSDGTHSANIILLGNYLSSTFVPSSDGHGGTNVIDPPAAAMDQSALVSQPHA
jgi:probable HAF family extracellular repeat protein